MRAAIFTEGSAQRGLGHLNRCLGPAQALRDRGFEIEWHVLADDFALDALGADGVRAHRLPDWTPDSVEAAGTGFDLVLVDSYLAPLTCYERLVQAAPRRLWIDDEARIDYPQGHVLNPNPLVVQKSPRTGEEERHLLSGFTFQLLRREFLEPFDRAIPDAPRRILVTMGGSDIRSLTPLAIAAARRAFPDAELTAVLPLEEQRIRWRDLAGPRVALLPGQCAAQMRRLMEEADLALGAGGQTLLECLRMGLPTVAIGAADNQRLQLEAVSGHGAVRIAGWFDDPGLPEELLLALRDLAPATARTLLSRKGRELVDGRGCQRCLDAVLADPGEVVLRLAGPEDMRSVWDISNAPGMRTHFLDPEPIPWERHVDWFASAIRSGNTLFLVACLGDEVVGQLRYLRHDHLATVSISLLGRVRGRGLAARLLREGDRRAFEAWPALRAIHAEVAPANASSLRAFENAGYARTTAESRHGERIFYVLERLRGASMPPEQTGLAR